MNKICLKKNFVLIKFDEKLKDYAESIYLFIYFSNFVQKSSDSDIFYYKLENGRFLPKLNL